MLQLRSAAFAEGLCYYASPLLERLGVPHAFSTRTGGVSPPPFDSLNLGIAGDAAFRDASDNLEENYRRLRAAVGCADLGRCWVTQVHGADLCDIHPGCAFENGARANALVSDDPTRVLSVKYADCVPLLLASADGGAVAAVHAGWRGLVAGVIRAAVNTTRANRRRIRLHLRRSHWTVHWFRRLRSRPRSPGRLHMRASAPPPPSAPLTPARDTLICTRPR